MPYNQILQISQPQLGSPTSIALIPGGSNRLVAGFTGGAIVLFDTSNGNILRSNNREDQQSTINSVAWSQMALKLRQEAQMAMSKYGTRKHCNL